MSFSLRVTLFTRIIRKKYENNLLLPKRNFCQQNSPTLHVNNIEEPPGATLDIKNARLPLSFSECNLKRRLQANRSILVQVNSPQSSAELLTYCKNYGDVNCMSHYTTGSEPLHYIIVEFKNEISVQNVIATSSHVTDGDFQSIPVRSPFLWFRASSKKSNKTRDKEVITELGVINGTKIIEENKLLSLLSKAEDISDQMQILHKSTCLSDTGTRIRYLACKQIELALSGMFPLVQASPFGSSVNSFGKEGCDLDIVIKLDQKSKDYSESRLAFHSKASLMNERSQTQRQMECIADILQLFLPGCGYVRRILQARVPIIKYNQEQTGLECDLSMTNMSGVYMSDLLYTLSSIDERVQPLVFTIRKWAQCSGLTSSNPGRWITNFSLTLLAINFLQKVNILPPINKLFKLAGKEDQIITDEGVNCSFLHDLSKLPPLKTPNKDSVQSLLLQFFEHFSAFDFTTKAISLNDGRDIIKPEHCALYIVNPLERHFNVSKNVSLEELERLRIELRNAAWTLESADTVRIKNSSTWGLIPLFQSTNIRNVFNVAPLPNRLVEIKGLFENDSSNKNGIEKIMELTKHSKNGNGNEVEPIKSRNKEKKIVIQRQDREKLKRRRKR